MTDAKKEVKPEKNVRLWAILHISGTNFLGFQGIIKNQKFRIFKESQTFPWCFFDHFQPIYATLNTKTQKYQKKISKFQSWHFSIIFDYKLLQWVQGSQALILAIFEGFQAFTVKNLEIQGDLERRFSVKISPNDGFQKHGKKKCQSQELLLVSLLHPLGEIRFSCQIIITKRVY